PSRRVTGPGRGSTTTRGGGRRGPPPRVLVSPAPICAGRVTSGTLLGRFSPLPPKESFVIAAAQLKVAMVIMHNGKPHRVTNVLHVTPGNGRGMVQTRLVNIETGSNTEHRFRSEDKVDRAHLEQHNLQYSYRAADDFHFMNTENYEMVALHSDVLGDTVGY